MSVQHEEFARALVAEVLRNQETLRPHPEDPRKLAVQRPDGRLAGIDLTPFRADPQPATADRFFRGVETVDGLLDAYWEARRAAPFEEDLPGAHVHVDAYAREFLAGLVTRARNALSDEEARRIANWVSHFDLYVAVKAVESLLNSQADQTLLKVAPELGWTVHFDHLAIRCGSSARGDAERVVENLRRHHAYVPSRVPGEDHYRFEDGWNAYLLYKMLDNGQVLRLFIDQSEAGHPTQIIQHWNHVYGYTAHHLAIRATRREQGRRLAVSLPELMRAVHDLGVETMTPTGEYTDGLLLQVFTRPERNRDVPERIRQTLRPYGAELETVIENAKLLELLSRREMQADFATRFYALYGLKHDADNPLHSAPVYNYFLPEQAAHVIRTSIERVERSPQGQPIA
jgi:hypothetical protein